MRCLCPHCSQLVVQDKSENGINFCPYCQELFAGVEIKLSPWILGVLVVLMATWQIMYVH
jgi:ribosomal protein L37AE/L43A